MKFSQHVVVNAVDEDALLNLVREDSANLPPGLIALRLLRFRDQPGRYAIQADFDSRDSATKSNDRPETQAWAKRLREMIEGDPEYENLDVVFERHP